MKKNHVNTEKNHISITRDRSRARDHKTDDVTAHKMTIATSQPLYENNLKRITAADTLDLLSATELVAMAVFKRNVIMTVTYLI